jgi:aryl-alcohol dehydrogenase-like predicted oxidoreductase
VGFGGIPIRNVAETEAIRIINRAINLGINYFHTSPGYGDSATKIGHVMRERRDECVLNWKCFALSREDGESCIKRGLKLLQTDRIDVVQLRLDKEHFEKAMGREGSFQFFKEAQREGVIGHIGVTSHTAKTVAEAMTMEDFSNVVVPFNYMATDPIEDLFPTAKRFDLGITAMKPLGRGALKNVSTALNYIWSHGVHSAIVGMQTIAEVEENAAIGDNLHDLTKKEEEEIKSWRKKLLETHEVSRSGALTSKNTR